MLLGCQFHRRMLKALEITDSAERADVLLAVAYAYAADAPATVGRIAVARAQMNRDLMIRELSAETGHVAFAIIGEPDIRILDDYPTGKWPLKSAATTPLTPPPATLPKEAPTTWPAGCSTPTPVVHGIVSGQDRLEDLFDEVEYLMGIAYMAGGLTHAPHGRAAWRSFPSDQYPGAVVKRHAQVLVASGIFDGHEQMARTCEAYDEQLRSSPSRWR